jgi:NAD(P) transhydrogenase
MKRHQFDLIVIGSGPAGLRAAIQGASLGKRVAVMEKQVVTSSKPIIKGRLPGKTLSEAVAYLLSIRRRHFHGSQHVPKKNIAMQDLLLRANNVVGHERETTRNQLLQHRIELLEGRASFLNDHTIRLVYPDGQGHAAVSASVIIIATGTESTRDVRIPFDGQRIFVSDDVLHLEELPKSLAIIGAGIIGSEYASIFGALGVRVTLIDKQQVLLPFVDNEIGEALASRMRDSHVTLRLNEDVTSLQPIINEHGKRVLITLTSGNQIVSEKAMYCLGRNAATHSLDLELAGLKSDVNGQIHVNEFFQTDVAHIYAVGDVIGFPSLASTSMEQGRVAACHAFGATVKSVPVLFPYSIYSIPEISFVGKTERELTAAAVPYEVGKANFEEISDSRIDKSGKGLLKLIFHSRSRQLLGVHIIGNGASELVHIGQTVMAYNGTIDHFVETIFNFPTIAECYTNAAFDGINRLAV